MKAANHVECPPKERYLRKIVVETSIARPPADVAYCIHALARCLAKTRNWIVALKTLVVIHRLLREGDPTFHEELLNFTQRVQVLQLSNFKDDSSPISQKFLHLYWTSCLIQLNNVLLYYFLNFLSF